MLGRRAPKMLNDLLNHIAAQDAENVRLTQALDGLLSDDNGLTPGYARLTDFSADGRAWYECGYCDHEWVGRENETHAGDCPVVSARKARESKRA